MLYVGIIGILFVTDFLVKKWIEKTKKVNVTEEHCKGRLLLRRTNNEGMALGFLKNQKEKVQLFHAVALIVTALTYLTLLLKKGYIRAKVGLSLVLGGGLSNWFDRKRQGYVTDYFSFKCKWKKFENIVFNLSDIFIFVGCFLLFVSQIGNKKKR